MMLLSNFYSYKVYIFLVRFLQNFNTILINLNKKLRNEVYFYFTNKIIIMQLQEVFWQNKLSPKELIIDWDKFISLFDEFILETISLKLNHVQKDYIKALIDPENRNLVYKNSYMLFVKNFWELPSNRTRLLKGQLNLSKKSKLKQSIKHIDEQSVIIKLQYIADLQQSSQSIKCLRQRFYELKKNLLYTLDTKNNIISQKQVNVDSFLTLGSGEKNDITIQDCSSINQQHFKLIKLMTKKYQQKKPFYMYVEQEDSNALQTTWYVRDVSKSNRLQYLLPNPWTYVVLRRGLTIKIGLTEQYELHVVNATPDDIQEHHIKQLTKLLNTDRINYFGEIDSSVPQKFIFDIPINQVKPTDIQMWYNQDFNYQGKENTVVKKMPNSFQGNVEQIPLNINLVDKVTQQVKEYKLTGESIKIGRNKQNRIVIDKVTIRKVECELVCITGIWMIKNVPENCITLGKKLTENQRINEIIKKIKLKQLSVGLTIESSVQDLQSSNRIKLSPACSHQIKAKNIIINVSFPKIKENYR